MIGIIKKYNIALLLFINLMITISPAMGQESDKNIDVIEDALIIDGLNENEEKSPAEKNVNEDSYEPGEIIYDDSFGGYSDSSEDKEIKSKKVNNPTRNIKDNNKVDKTNQSKKNENLKKTKSHKRSSKSTHLKKLQSEDPRWHFIKYKIKKNDNLWSIARKYDSNYRLIIKINNIKKPDHIKPGKFIIVPSKEGVYHKVKRGDTLLKLSRKYKARVDSIRKHNNIKRDILKLNKKIFIPEGKRVYNSGKRSTAKKKRLISKNEKKQNRKKTDKYLEKEKKFKKEIYLLGKSNFAWPLKGRISSHFGMRNDPFSGKRKFHCGIDISVVTGTRVKSARAGHVIFSGWKSGYGKVVVLKHKKGYISVYAHLSKLLCKKGEKVNSKQVIALSGSTGRSTGPHLHFEIRKYLTPLNPLRMLK